MLNSIINNNNGAIETINETVLNGILMRDIDSNKHFKMGDEWEDLFNTISHQNETPQQTPADRPSPQELAIIHRLAEELKSTAIGTNAVHQSADDCPDVSALINERDAILLDPTPPIINTPVPYSTTSSFAQISSQTSIHMSSQNFGFDSNLSRISTVPPMEGPFVYNAHQKAAVNFPATQAQGYPAPRPQSVYGTRGRGHSNSIVEMYSGLTSNDLMATNNSSRSPTQPMVSPIPQIESAQYAGPQAMGGQPLPHINDAFSNVGRFGGNEYIDENRSNSSLNDYYNTPGPSNEPYPPPVIGPPLRSASVPVLANPSFCCADCSNCSNNYMPYRRSAGRPSNRQAGHARPRKATQAELRRNLDDQFDRMVHKNRGLKWKLHTIETNLIQVKDYLRSIGISVSGADAQQTLVHNQNIHQMPANQPNSGHHWPDSQFNY